jgi:hypothetical protein
MYNDQLQGEAWMQLRLVLVSACERVPGAVYAGVGRFFFA